VEVERGLGCAKGRAAALPGPVRREALAVPADTVDGFTSINALCHRGHNRESTTQNHRSAPLSLTLLWAAEHCEPLAQSQVLKREFLMGAEA